MKPGDQVISLDEKTGKLVPARINALLDMGVKQIYKITTEDGKTIRTTGNHPYLVNQKALTNQSPLIRRPVELNHIPQSGTVRVSIDSQNRLTSASDHLRNINYTTENYEIKSNNTFNVEDVVFGSVNGIVASIDTCYQCISPINALSSPSVDKLENAQWTEVAYLNEGDEIAVANLDNVGHTMSYIEFEKIVSIEILPPEQVYDIEVEGTHNFVANGIIAHNTYITHASISDDFEANYGQIASATLGTTILTGDLSGIRASLSDSLTATDIIRGGSLTDGTLTITSGNLTSGRNFSFTRASVSDWLTVSDSATITNNLSVGGTITADGVYTSDSIDFDEIVDNATLDNNWIVGGTGYYVQFPHASVSDDFETLSAQITSASVGTLYSGSTSLSGNLDMQNNLILNIGAAGTDFTTGGGLNLAGTLLASGSSQLGGAVELDNTASISGDITGYGALTISGTTDLANVAAFTLTGAITGNSQDITGLDDLGAVALVVTHASISDDFETLSAQITSASFGTIYGIGSLSGDYASISQDFQVGTNTLYVNVGSGSYQFGGTGSASFLGDIDLDGNLNVGGNDLYVDNSSGYVGIGTTGPGAKLSVHLNESNTNTVPYINLFNDAGGYADWQISKTGSKCWLLSLRRSRILYYY